jgi:hypothetical protein
MEGELMNTRASLGFAAVLLMLGFGASTAEAAMCGRSCNGGGRYYQGPPSVCAEYGLNYCGPSRPAPAPGVGVYVPGTGVGVGVGPGGVVVGPGSNCRTITVERDDGSVRRIRRCD